MVLFEMLKTDVVRKFVYCYLFLYLCKNSQDFFK